MAECSLRGQGTVIAVVSGGQGASGVAVTTSVGSDGARAEPGGLVPAVSVIRSRPSSGPAAAATSSTAARGVASPTGTSRPRPRAERWSRARWRRTAKGRPRTTLSVSKTPSPTVSPRSNTETVASAGSTSRPSSHTATAPRSDTPRHRSRPAGGRRAGPRARRRPSVARARGRRRPRRHGQQPAGLQLGLGPLALGCRPPGDAAPGAEVQQAVLEPEGPDRHVELAPAGVGVDPPDGAAVHAAGPALEPGDV